MTTFLNADVLCEADRILNKVHDAVPKQKLNGLKYRILSIDAFGTYVIRPLNDELCADITEFDVSTENERVSNCSSHLRQSRLRAVIEALSNIASFEDALAKSSDVIFVVRLIPTPRKLFFRRENGKRILQDLNADAWIFQIQDPR